MTSTPALIRRLPLVATALVALGLRLSPDLLAQDPAQSATAAASDSGDDYNKANWKATGSSTPDMQTSHGSNDPQKALDGAADGKFSFVTNVENHPWWMVDFGKAIPVWSITIYNDMFTPGCQKLIKNFRVWVAPDDGSGNPPTTLAWQSAWNHKDKGFFENNGQPVGGLDPKSQKETIPGPKVVRVYSALTGKDKNVRYIKIDLDEKNPASLHLDQVLITPGITAGPAPSILNRPSDGDDILSGN